jgi:hypothetical protein
MSSAQRNPVQQIAARFLPKQESKPIVTYVEGVDPITRRGMKKIVKENLHPLRNFGIWMAVGTVCGLVSISSVNYTLKMNKELDIQHYFLHEMEKGSSLANNNQVKAKNDSRNSSVLQAAVGGTASLVYYAGSVFFIGGSLNALRIPRRKREGLRAASELFDEFLTNDGAINGVKLLPSMQKFFASKKLFDGNDDPAAISYIANGQASVDAILSIFEVDESDILETTVAKLNCYNDLPEGSSQDEYFSTLTAQFTDPKFIGALALGIFSGDDHQELVDALTQYGDKDELHKAMISLCTNASVFIDVANKLQERIPDSLDRKILSKARELEQRRFVLIKDCHDIAEGFEVKLSPNADIDAVNAAFAALDLSGVVNLPSKANDDRREAQLEAQFAAQFADLEDGATAAQPALNPAQQPPLELGLAQLEQVVDEGRGGGR